MSLLQLVLLAGIAVHTAPAHAVLIASGDGSGNVAAPADDPGWDHACVRLPGELSCVYLGNGWVLTAAHAGAGTVLLGSAAYAALPGSAHAITSPANETADLLMFRIAGEPGLGVLPLQASTPALDASVTLIGNGFDRGASLTWSEHSGWSWDTALKQLRWGTNRVHEHDLDVTIGSTTTRSLAFDFDAVSGGTNDEAAGVVGDSGGPVFLKNGGTWELAGTLFAIAGYDGQPVNSSLDGNLTYAADLSYYRAQILAWLVTSVCDDGLDNDGDGEIDGADGGCKNTSDASERFDCEDQLDNDADHLFDWPLDPGCSSRIADIENPECNDGVDNDGDTLVDLADSGCTVAYLSYESAPASCGLGPEIGPLLGLVALRWTRRAISSTIPPRARARTAS